LSQVDKKEVFARIGYDPHPKQWLFHNSEARFKKAACGRRFGKSKMAAAELFVNEHANIWDENLIFWIVGPRYIHGAKEFRYFMRFLKHARGPNPQKSLWDYCRPKAFNPRQGDMHVTLPWGTEVVVMSAQRKDDLVGEGLAGIIVCEAAKHDSDTWNEYLSASLADLAPNSWAAMTSTPEGYNWFHTEFELGESKSLKKLDDHDSWNFPAWENHHVYPGGREDPEIKRMETAMIAAGMEDVFWQEIGASFRSVVGLVYGNEYDDELHIYEEYWEKPYEYNPKWENGTGIDFGFTNPLVVLDIQIDPMDNIYIWREHYKAKMSTPQHISAIKERSDPEGYAVSCGYGDSAYPDGVEQFSMSLWPVMAEDDAKEWRRGVDEVKQRLIGEDGLPHIWVSKNCPMTIWEFQNYRIKAVSGDQNAPEKAQSYADHAMDALRYFIMHRFVLFGGGSSLAEAMAAARDQQKTTEEDGKGFFTAEKETVFSMNQVL
jgi:hypothetical protein